jgi:hypothetical protein
LDKKFLPDWRLRSRRMLELSDPGHKTAMFWFSGGVFSGWQDSVAQIS